MGRRLMSLILSIMLCSGVIAGVLLPAGPAAAARPLWYLAEGTTAWGFDAQISIQNPNTQGVWARVTYVGNSGIIKWVDYFLWPTSQTNINVKNDIGQQDFSAKVECTDATKTIAVDRTMYWMGGPGSEANKTMETHGSIGVTAPSTVWFLPDGSSAWGFETWLLIQNPNAFDVTCNVTYMIEGGLPVVVGKVVPANSRRTYNMYDDIGSHDASIRVETPPGQPVIAERAMYRNSRRLGTESVGASEAANVYCLGEGSSAWGFTTYLLVQNPNGAPVDVQVWFLTPGGSVPAGTFSMPALSRKTIRVNDILPNQDCSIYVQGVGGSFIVAERSMLWGGDTVFGEAAHASIGVTGPHKYWYAPGGGCGPLEETWTLVQNPTASPVDFELAYMSDTGAATAYLKTVPAYSRMSFSMADHVPSGRYSVRVTALTGGGSLIVENSIYGLTDAGKLYRTAGSNSVAAWED
jgi:hypothetical protein